MSVNFFNGISDFKYLRLMGFGPFTLSFQNSLSNFGPITLVNNSTDVLSVSELFLVSFFEMGTRESEITVVEGLWATLDDQQLIKDVVMKGKYLLNAIKFIASRNEISIDEAKDLFFNEVNQYVNNLIKNKQLHRANHVLKNVQFNEFYYLFDFYQVCCLFIFYCCFQ